MAPKTGFRVEGACRSARSRSATLPTRCAPHRTRNILQVQGQILASISGGKSFKLLRCPLRRVRAEVQGNVACHTANQARAQPEKEAGPLKAVGLLVESRDLKLCTRNSEMAPRLGSSDEHFFSLADAKPSTLEPHTLDRLCDKHFPSQANAKP